MPGSSSSNHSPDNDHIDAGRPHREVVDVRPRTRDSAIVQQQDRSLRIVHLASGASLTSAETPKASGPAAGLGAFWCRARSSHQRRDGTALSCNASARADVWERMAGTRRDLDIEEYEALVQFLIELTDLIRSEHAYEYDQLRVIDQAIDIAIADNPDAAIAYVHDVVLGRVEP
jgi:hypothetical protein